MAKRIPMTSRVASRVRSVASKNADGRNTVRTGTARLWWAASKIGQRSSKFKRRGRR